MACVFIVPARLSSSTYPTLFPRVLFYFVPRSEIERGRGTRGSQKRVEEKLGNEVGILGNNVELEMEEISVKKGIHIN